MVPGILGVLILIRSRWMYICKRAQKFKTEQNIKLAKARRFGKQGKGVSEDQKDNPIPEF